MIIKQISIRNFRSIQTCDLLLNNLSVLVGQNDVGKSNVLKALNLFFNNETDFGKTFHFLDDYSKYAPKKNKKAPEIIIELIITPPKHYKESKDIKWVKVWRQNGLFYEDIINVDRTTFPKRSKINFWIKNIRFEYIPAIRDTQYFTNLLGKLHDTLAETIEIELRKAGENFIKSIRSNTKDMVIGLSKRLGMNSEIRLPTSLQSLFKVLDFETIDGMNTISLSNRGDGIKTRHIPVILKFIADQLNITRAKGSPSINLLWGYEEPENNLELSIAFKLANDFLEYSSEIQILLTTHSPGFYNLKSSSINGVNIFNVTKPSGMPAMLQNIKDVDKIDEDLGLMPIVTPYINKKFGEISALQNELKQHKSELAKLKSNIIFVEGDDETRIFNKIISLKKKSNQIAIRREAFGCTGVRQQIMAWSWVSSFSKLKAVGIFDLDDSGKNEKGKLEDDEQYRNANNIKKVKALTYSVPPHLLGVKRKFPLFPIELEEMYSPIVWKHCETQGWLEKRTDNSITKFAKNNNINQTISQFIKSHKFNQQEELYIFYMIPDKHKDKVSKYISKQLNNKLKQLIPSLIDFFDQSITKFLLA